jgi:hypothetical protein
VFNGAVVFAAAVAFFSSIFCSTLLPQFLFLNLSLILSRILFIVSDILIITRQYEYHARFALSVSQSCFSFIIAIIIAFAMYEYVCYSSPSKQTNETENQEIKAYTPRESREYINLELDQTNETGNQKIQAYIPQGLWKYVNVEPENSHMKGPTFQIQLGWAGTAVIANSSLDMIPIPNTDEMMEINSERGHFKVRIKTGSENGSTSASFHVEVGDVANPEKKIPEIWKDLSGKDPKVQIEFSKLEDNRIETTICIDGEKYPSVMKKPSTEISLHPKIFSRAYIKFKKVADKIHVSVSVCISASDPKIFLLNGEIRLNDDAPVTPPNNPTDVVYSSKPRKLTGFRSRKPSSQLTRLDYSNGLAPMKWKRIMSSDVYNPTNA